MPPGLQEMDPIRLLPSGSSCPSSWSRRKPRNSRCGPSWTRTRPWRASSNGCRGPGRSSPATTSTPAAEAATRSARPPGATEFLSSLSSMSCAGWKRNRRVARESERHRIGRRSSAPPVPPCRRPVGNPLDRSGRSHEMRGTYLPPLVSGEWRFPLAEHRIGRFCCFVALAAAGCREPEVRLPAIERPSGPLTLAAAVDLSLKSWFSPPSLSSAPSCRWASSAASWVRTCARFPSERRARCS